MKGPAALTQAGPFSKIKKCSNVPVGRDSNTVAGEMENECNHDSEFHERWKCWFICLYQVFQRAANGEIVSREPTSPP